MHSVNSRVFKLSEGATSAWRSTPSVTGKLGRLQQYKAQPCVVFSEFIAVFGNLCAVKKMAFWPCTEQQRCATAADRGLRMKQVASADTDSPSGIVEIV